MKPRELLAPFLLAARAVAAKPPPGSYRILLLHDVPVAQYERLERLLDYLGHDAFAARRFVLNFDDGLKGNRDVAERLLAPRGIKATFFISPALVGQDGYMGWDDLAALAESGHVIGAHGMSHRRLAGLNGTDLETEVVRPGEAISAKLGQAPEWFAFPFGDIDSIDAAALALIGRHYRLCRSGVRGPNVPGTHRLAVLADHVDLESSFAWQRLTVAGGLDGRYAQARERLRRWAAEAANS
jgi:peptidoglycan/xylan/chitin deacetylase (PgdA/CDA1 family)